MRASDLQKEKGIAALQTLLF